MTLNLLKSLLSILSQLLIIIKFINGNPQAYNYINHNFSDFELSNFDAIIFKDKQKALNFVEYLCDEDRNHPVFLSAIKVTD